MSRKNSVSIPQTAPSLTPTTIPSTTSGDYQSLPILSTGHTVQTSTISEIVIPLTQSTSSYLTPQPTTATRQLSGTSVATELQARQSPTLDLTSATGVTCSSQKQPDQSLLTSRAASRESADTREHMFPILSEGEIESDYQARPLSGGNGDDTMRETNVMSSELYIPPPKASSHLGLFSAIPVSEAPGLQTEQLPATDKTADSGTGIDNVHHFIQETSLQFPAQQERTLAQINVESLSVFSSESLSLSIIDEIDINEIDIDENALINSDLLSYMEKDILPDSFRNFIDLAGQNDAPPSSEISKPSVQDPVRQGRVGCTMEMTKLMSSSDGTTHNPSTTPLPEKTPIVSKTKIRSPERSTVQKEIKKKLPCKNTHKPCGTIEKLDSHYNNQHNNLNRYKRDICEKYLIWIKNLTRHKKNHSELKPLQCDICNKAFKNKHHLIRHRKTHSKERPFKCDICNKTFKHKHILSRHRKTHSKESPFKCDICQNAFTLKKTLNEHMTIHDNQKTFKCDTCGKVFYVKRYLKRHIKNHQNQRDFICNICHKAFKLKQTLKEHMTIHDNQKPFKCDTCGKAFNLRKDLNRHMKDHQNPSQPLAPNPSFMRPDESNRRLPDIEEPDNAAPDDIYVDDSNWIINPSPPRQDTPSPPAHEAA